MFKTRFLILALGISANLIASNAQRPRISTIMQAALTAPEITAGIINQMLRNTQTDLASAIYIKNFLDHLRANRTLSQTIIPRLDPELLHFWDNYLDELVYIDIASLELADHEDKESEADLDDEKMPELV